MKKVERRFFLKSSAAVSAFAFVNPGFGKGSDTRAAGNYSSEDSAEIALNRKWAENSFSHHIPFSFVYGGKNSADFLDKWKSQVKDEKIDTTKRRLTLILNDPETGLEVRAIATIYTDTAGVDWTLHFTNKGGKDTPVLEKVKAIDVTINPGDNTNPPVLQRIHGGGGAVDDWMPFNETLETGSKTEFAPTAGRSSFGNTPWFNLQWKGGGVITAIGWTGQWKATVENNNGNFRIQAGMQNLHMRLLPGETIRSPRIMQLYWTGNDELRAFNLFRHTMFAHIVPKVDGKSITPPIVHLSSAFYEMDKGTEADTLSHLSAVKDLGFEYFWVDAYYGKDDFPTVGNYVFPLMRAFNLQRYPNGMKPVGDAVKKAGMKFLMWFEYERICPGTLMAGECSTLLSLKRANTLPGICRIQSGNTGSIGFALTTPSFMKACGQSSTRTILTGQAFPRFVMWKVITVCGMIFSGSFLSW
jgi:alpha-galactosidase